MNSRERIHPDASWLVLAPKGIPIQLSGKGEFSLLMFADNEKGETFPYLAIYPFGIDRSKILKADGFFFVVHHSKINGVWKTHDYWRISEVSSGASATRVFNTKEQAIREFIKRWGQEREKGLPYLEGVVKKSIKEGRSKAHLVVRSQSKEEVEILINQGAQNG